MPVLKTYNNREFIRLLKDNGYIEVRHNGKHVIYSNGVHTFPLTQGHKLEQNLAQAIIKKYNLK